jgi:hypothetical protein
LAVVFLKYRRINYSILKIRDWSKSPNLLKIKYLKNELFGEVLSDCVGLLEFLLLDLFVVYRKSTRRNLCWVVAHYHTGFCHSH